jgi:ribonuclease HI
VDSSFQSDRKSQAGYVYHSPDNNRRVVESSEVFEAENNNTAEIMGVYYAVKAIHDKYSITSFRIYCDSIISVAMLDKHKKTSKKLLNKHPALKFVLDYFKKNEIDVITEHLSRSAHMLKIADKKSKEFRKEKEYGWVEKSKVG